MNVNPIRSKREELIYVVMNGDVSPLNDPGTIEVFEVGDIDRSSLAL